jgi:hypothetical protein
MKKIYVTFFFLVFVAIVTAQKYKKSEVSNVIKVNPISIIYGKGSISYERVINEKSSLQANIYVGGITFGGEKLGGFGFGIDYKRFLSDLEAPRGFYLSPGIEYGTLSLPLSDAQNSIPDKAFSTRGIIGKQWVKDSGFTIDIFGGIYYFLTGDDRNKDGSLITKKSGFLRSFGISFGFAF